MDNYIKDNRIKEALQLRGMKQVELAEKTGLSKASINNWISQRWQPKQKAIMLMARVLDVAELWLAGYDVPMERPVEQKKNDELVLLIHELRENESLKKICVNLSKLTPEQKENKVLEEICVNLSKLTLEQLVSINNIISEFSKINDR